MNNRMKIARKKRDLTLKQVADMIHITESAVSKFEHGATPSEQTLVLFCEKLNVNRHWLETGEGEMFLPKPESSLPAELSNDPMIRAILEAYLDLDAQGRQTFQRFFSDVVARYKGDSPAHQPSPAEQARARGGIPLDDFNNSSQSKSS